MVRLIRRGVWFLLGRLVLLLLLLGLVVVVFYEAMDYSNIQIIIKDGMAHRAQTVLGMEDGQDLGKYFQQSFLANDAALILTQQGDSPYRDYTIRGLDHRIEMSFLWVWPWENRCTVSVVERIPAIDGRIRGDKADAAVAAFGPGAVYPPAWQSAQYRITLNRENGQWKMQRVDETERLSD